MTATPSSRSADGIYEPFPTNDVPWDEFAHGEHFGMRYQQLGNYGGGTKVGVCIEELAPGKQGSPAHYHMLEEEHLYILEGSLTLRLGNKRFEMSAGHYACFPAGQKAGHTLINRGTSICRYLIIGERNPHDVIVYPDSGRVSVRLTGEGYRKTEVMDYWEGVEPGFAVGKSE